MSDKNIHKAKNWTADIPKCGYLGYTMVTFRWKCVTCKKCLKLKRKVQG